MQKKRILIVIVALLAVGAGLYWLLNRNIQSTDDAQIEAHVIPMSVKVPGYVTKLNIRDNGVVEAGAELLEIDPRDYAIRRDQAAASLMAAQSNADNAAINLKRMQSMGNLARSRKDLDDATEAANTANAQVAVAKAQLAQAEKDLNDTRLIAPEGGIVTDRGVEQGAYVTPGQQLFVLIPSARWVIANFKETQIRHMKEGQPVDIRIDAYPDVALRGHVDSIQRGSGVRFSLFPPENATGNYIKIVQRVPVKIVFEEGSIPPELVIGPGMSVVPRVDVSE